MTGTLDILERLIGFNSVSARSNLDIAEYIEAFLTARGFAVTRLTDPTGQKVGLHAVLGPAGAGVLLSGHMDVVPVEGQDWTRDPFKLTREGDRVYGRGTTDMKGYVASMLALADRVVQGEITAPLQIVLSYDEEVGCVGIRQMLDGLAPLIGQPRAAFVGEPTEMQVAIGHKGKVALKATCHGQAGHSALAPNFVNALHLASDFIAALRALQSDLAENGARDPGYAVPYSTVHVGMLHGGRALNIVPDLAEMTFEFRHLAADKADDLLSRITDAAQAVAQAYTPRFADARIDVAQTNAYPGLDVAADHPVIGYAQAMAQTNSTTKVAFGTEAGFFDGLGIPTVVCGPGSMEGQGHKPDEYITLDQLAACDRMMDRILHDLSA